MTKINRSPKKGIRTAAVFIALAFVLQLVFVLLMTPQGLSHIYPFLVRSRSEEITADASFAEYYDLRNDFADGELFLLGADMGVSRSYFVILDYLRFLKKSYDISTVALNVSDSVAQRMNEYISTDDDAVLAEIESSLKSGVTKTEEFQSFLKDLRTFNGTLTPQRKLKIVGIATTTVEDDIIKPFKDKMISNIQNMDPVIIEALSYSDAKSFLEYFDQNIGAFEEYLSAKNFKKYCNARDLYMAGLYDDSKLFDQIKNVGEGKALCVVDNERIAPTSKLFSYLDEFGRKYYSVQTKYDNCHTALSANRTAEVNDISLPFVSDVRVGFLSGRETESFVGYYRYVANPSGDSSKALTASYFDDNFTYYYFIVSNSPPVSYGGESQ